MNYKQPIEEAYSGKRVFYGNKPYVLQPEVHKGSCLDCALYNSHCTSRITSLCTQGFILKKDGQREKE